MAITNYHFYRPYLKNQPFYLSADVASVGIVRYYPTTILADGPPPLARGGLSKSAREPKQKPPPLSAKSCEGEVASVQGEYRIYDSFGTDDGRGVLSAQELSNNYS